MAPKVKHKIEAMVKIGLVGSLAYCAVSLNAQRAELAARRTFEESFTNENLQLIARSTSGVDVAGRLVHQELPTNARRFVLFALREQSLHEDLLFWNAVAGLLAADWGVYVIGYCDGPPCATTVQSAGDLIRFTVIAYGEAVATQAVFNADLRGNSLVSDGQMTPLRQIEWRSSGRVPSDIVAEVLR